jgi:membrane protease YdiL (CAAX protease family)
LGKVTIQYSPRNDFILCFFLAFFGPKTEELGWRGVALPELVKRYGFTIAVIFLGLMWAIWHLPLFFIKGSYHYKLGLGSPAFWNYMLSIISISILYGAVYSKADKSILIIILFHYLDNLAGETFQICFSAKIWESIFRATLALLVLLYQNKLFQGNSFPRKLL